MLQKYERQSTALDCSWTLSFIDALKYLQLIYLRLKLLMNLQTDHSHSDRSQNPVKARVKKSQFNQKAETSKYFNEQLARSETKLYQDTQINITKMRQLRQKKIYANLGISPLEYLFILFEERRHNLQDSSEAMEDVLNKRKKKVISELSKEEISIKKSKTLLQIKQQLNQNIQLLKAESSTLKHEKRQSLEQLENQKYAKNNDQFRQKSYWKVPNQKAESIKVFIKSLREKQNKQHKRYENKLKEKEQKQQEHQLSLQKAKQLKQKQLKQELHKSFATKKQQKLKQIETNKKKSQEVEVFLQKFKEKPPNYILFSERYRKRQSEEQKQRKEFLNQLKQSKRHSSLSQIREQMKKYDELKEIHHMQRVNQRQQQQQQEFQIKQKLSQLYKSVKYEKYLKNQSPPLDESKVRQQKMIKMILYSKKAQTQHLPKLNQEKREQLLHQIEELNKKQDHKIRKIRDGNEIVIDKQELDPRKIGLQYLQQVKQITSQIQRKPKPVPEPKYQKIIDRSLIKNDFYNKKVTISNWKEIVQDKKLTEEEKNQKIKLYLKLVEQKNLQNTHQLRTSNLQRSIHLQKEIDHYEIQKTQAKLALLKSLK